jgi:two-component system, NtrC family, C4-dicarboxylate transport response regulator DctD
MAQVGVLLVDPDQTLAGDIRRALEGHGYEFRLVGSAAHALEVIGAGGVEAVLVRLSGDGVGALVADISGRWPDLPVVAVTEPGGRSQAAQARAAGAWDYLEPPGDLASERFLTIIANALDRRRLRRELRAAQAAAPETLNLEARERQAILAALEATRWNKQAAARLLGLHRPTLYAKMRKHGIPQAQPH